jgi:translocation and assembly module TamB
MKKVFTSFLILIGGLYFTLHLLLGSSPVQKRVLNEIRSALYELGIDLDIESIEFSAFRPRIYLNRVTLKPTSKLDIPLPEPLVVDKIKLQFQPLALLSKQIIIQEAVLFFPKIIVPQADKLYEKVVKLLSKKKMVVPSASFSVVFKKIGVVDALFEVISQDPNFSIRSRSLSFFIENSANEQQTLTASSKNLEFKRGPLELKLSKIEFDVDFTPKSVRVNVAKMEGDGLMVNLKGATSLPFLSTRPGATFRASYDVTLPLPLLNNISELKLPKLVGSIRSDGNVEQNGGNYSGSGTFNFDESSVEGFQLGKGGFRYALNQKRATISQLDVSFAEGKIQSDSLTVDLSERYPIAGELKVKDLRLRSLLTSLKAETALVYGTLNGSVKIGGKLSGPMALEADVKQSFQDFYVLDKLPLGRTFDNTIIELSTGSLEGKLSVSPERMTFKANGNVLGGVVTSEGNVGFDNRAVIKISGQNLSLTEMKHIAEVPFGGTANLSGVVDIKGSSAQIDGDYSVTNAEVAEIVLGQVRGSLHYDDKLLTFERLELPSIEPVRGRGFLDFRPKDNHYRFEVNARRASVDQIFQIFQKQKLSFPKPKGGEVNTRITLEGGHDNKSIEVRAAGQARGFSWYDERWLSTNFSVIYRPSFTEISRASLLKRSGALDVRGHFEESDAKTFLVFSSQGLRLEEFTYFGKAPVTGEVSGNLRLEGDLLRPAGFGDIRISKAAFRGVPIPDSSMKIRTDKGETEFSASVVGDRLRGRLVRREVQKGKPSELFLYFRDFDFAPLLSIWMGKDIPPLGDLRASGDMALKGILENWENVSGSGSISDLRLGLKNAPMKNENPIHVAIGEGAVKVDRFRLSGAESQLAMDFHYQPGKLVSGSLDGKMDLQHLQPFIPGVEFGVGRVGVGLRLSGQPPNFSLLGNMTLEEGTFRITGLSDEFKNTQVQLSLSQDRINVDRFDAQIGKGTVNVRGDVKIDRFKALVPNLSISASKVSLRTKNFLTTQVTGDFSLRGESMPYVLGGKCYISEARLTDFNVSEPSVRDEGLPILRFDVKGEAREKLFVTTDVMDAEFKGNFHLLGNTSTVGLLGNVEGVRGTLLFRETKFNMTNATVKFEDSQSILPRFNVSGKAVVREQRTTVPQDYEVNLQVFGTPKDYRVQLTSNPVLPEREIISLLLLGVTNVSVEGNYIDLGSVIAGQTPFQSKLQNEFGFEVKMGTQTGRPGSAGSVGSTAASPEKEVVVPNVKIQKDLTKKTKVSVSTTVGEEIPYKEYRIEHMLNDSFTVNGTVVDRNRSSGQTESVKSYGLDFRYHFTFE